jgi:adenosylcobinamide amidohydrolase
VGIGGTGVGPIDQLSSMYLVNGTKLMAIMTADEARTLASNTFDLLYTISTGTPTGMTVLIALVDLA